ncbi:MAG TPA: bifunctional diguanylate cyclase/phosphodiesterase [Candidatus Limnocylindria bacterium]|nr:bifunctional diguanylate cyclase/phosphodiesterase [Candidatus Limnocylindria bacterium]
MKRLGALNRANVVLMFVVIVAIGSCGLFSLERSRQSAALVARAYDRSKEYWRLTTALNLESAMLGAVLVDPGPLTRARVREAGLAFGSALALMRADDGDDAPVLRDVALLHGAFERDAHGILALIERGDLPAARLTYTKTMPTARALRTILDRASARSFDASKSQELIDQGVSGVLQRVIIAVTSVGIVLMLGITSVLGRYKRSVDAAAAEKIAALEEAALTDNLTKLGNHRAFYDDFARELARARRHRHALALALIDVDDFKGINDSGGHVHGDDVLAILGGRLASLRREDRAYRVGGDEFAVLLVEPEPGTARRTLLRLQDDARSLLRGATLSIGYVDVDPADTNLDPYECADSALYEAKRRGRNALVSFEEIRNKVSVFSRRKADAVRSLIAQGSLDVAFQPIWDLPNRALLGFEALARPAPELALAGPQEAFDVAERIRAVVDLDWLCVRKALEAASRLPAESTIFLNVSPESFTHASFDPEHFVAVLRDAGVAPERVVVELTERRIDDPHAIAARARALRALDVRMALDDTGVGHAGLEILSHVQLDFVKIDRSLLVKAVDNPGPRGVLAGIMAIARATGSYLIAEGVETADLFDFACRAHVPSDDGFPGVRGVQGNLLGCPETGPIDLEVLAEHRALLSAPGRGATNFA